MLKDFFSIFAKSIFLLLLYSYQNHQRNLRQQEHVVRDGEADVIETPAENIEQPNENDANVENNNQGTNEPVNQNQATPTSTESNTTTTTTSLAGDVEENNRLPTIMLLRTFILSFFSSLIPETPAA